MAIIEHLREPDGRNRRGRQEHGPAKRTRAGAAPGMHAPPPGRHRPARCSRGLTLTRRSRGLTLIQFMFVLVMVGIVGYWLVEYLRSRLG